MPSTRWMGALLVAMCLTFAACDGGDKIDTAKLEKSFSAAQPAGRQAVEDFKAAVAARDYAKASAALQKLAAGSALTTDQKQAIQDVSAQVAQKAAEIAKQVAKEGEKALGDVQKRLSN